MELGLSVEMEISGRAFAVSYYVELGGLWSTNVLNLALPPQRLRPATWPDNKRLSATWFRRKGRKKKTGRKEERKENSRKLLKLK